MLSFSPLQRADSSRVQWASSTHAMVICHLPARPPNGADPGLIQQWCNDCNTEHSTSEVLERALWPTVSVPNTVKLSIFDPHPCAHLKVSKSYKLSDEWGICYLGWVTGSGLWNWKIIVSVIERHWRFQEESSAILQETATQKVPETTWTSMLLLSSDSSSGAEYQFTSSSESSNIPYPHL